MDPNTEIRKLRPAELYTLARILAASDSWKTLMAVVPKEGTENIPKFNTEHFALIEQASCQQRKSGAEIFLEEWSTMGKRRPTLSSTLDLLIKVQLFRAADYIAVDLLQRQPPERPADGPAAKIDISDEEIAKLMNHADSEFDIRDSQFSKESLESVLDELEYPSQLSVPISVQNDQREVHQSAESNCHHQTRRIGVELMDEVSNLTIRPGEMNQNNSNLMQFSKSDVEVSQKSCEIPVLYNNSNLMQFSSNTILSKTTIDLNEDSLLANGACNTNLAVNAQILQRQTHASSSENVNEYSGQRIIREENIYVQENGVQVSNTPDREDSSNAGYDGSISNSTDCNKFELQSSELPTFVRDIGRDSRPMYSEVQSSELPQFVLEMAHQRSSNSNTTVDTESFGEPLLSNDSSSSNVSSNFLANVTSPSDNNTESNIPICVNFRSEILENHELVSAELPQFVADLGHRQNNDNSIGPVNGAGEFSTEQYTGQFVGSRYVSTYEYVGLNSQELPLVVSECNKMRSQLEERPQELDSGMLPQCVTELQSVLKK